MQKLIPFIFGFFCSWSLFSQSSQSFTEDFQVIANPERGFYHHTETSSGNYSHLSESTLKNYRINEGITQILRVFYLSDFKSSPISSAFLNNMRVDFSTARKAGVKVIVRFAYTKKTTSPFGDAPLSQVVIHIDQLKQVLNENVDVIAAVQAGFVGAWGEWYYTDYFSTILGGPNTQDWESRRTLIHALLEAIPASRFVQVRTPAIKTTVLQDNIALTEENAYSEIEKARIGHHNDCFVASSSDVGTYVNPTVEKPYMEADTKYLPVGGETCGVAPPYSDCPYSTDELERFHWSYMNKDYHPDVLNGWANQGCFDEIELKLGYRYILNEVTATTTVKPGNTLNFNLTFKNDGYSNPYNARLVELVLKSKATGDEYYLSLSEDPRKWSLNDEIQLTETAGIPSDAPEGTYDLFLNLPDPMESLYGVPAYSIRCANAGVWVDSLGYNDLGVDVTLSSSATGTSISNESLFIPRTTSHVATLPNSGELLSGATDTQLLLFWGTTSSTKTRVIEKSTDGVSFEPLATLSADIPYYLISDASEGHFRYFLSENGQYSSYSDTTIVALNTNYNGYSPIAIDGSDADWAAIPPVASSSEDGFHSARVFFDAEMANFILYGTPNEYAIYLNTDNLTTGITSSSTDGFDFLLRNDSLYQATNGVWVYIQKAENQRGNDLIELRVPLSSLQNLNQNRVIPLSFIVETNGTSVPLSYQSATVINYYRALAPDVPQNVEVSKSTSLPDTRLQVRWDQCENCTGYQIERSIDGITFSEIKAVLSTTTFINDDNLTINTTYYYRLYSYNDLGNSVYSEIVSGTTGPIEEEVLSLTDTEVSLPYPNPFTDKITLSVTTSFQTKIEVFDLTGKMIVTDLATQSTHVLDLTRLKKGVFILKVSTQGKSRSFRIMKE